MHRSRRAALRLCPRPQQALELAHCLAAVAGGLESVKKSPLSIQAEIAFEVGHCLNAMAGRHKNPDLDL